MNWHLPFLFLTVSFGTLIHIRGLGMKARETWVSGGGWAGGSLMNNMVPVMRSVDAPA